MITDSSDSLINQVKVEMKVYDTYYPSEANAPGRPKAGQGPQRAQGAEWAKRFYRIPATFKSPPKRITH